VRVSRKSAAGWCRVADEHVGSQGDQLFREQLRLIGTGGGKTIINSDVAAFRPTKPLKPLPERREAGLRFRIVLGIADKHSDPPHLIRLLRTRGERPRRRRTTQNTEKFPPPHAPSPLRRRHRIGSNEHFDRG
jgi:hypothetical protein